MWEEIIKLAVGNGLWAVLFCALLFYELKDSRKREAKYVETISSLGKKLDVVNSVKEDTARLLKIVADRKASDATAEKIQTAESELSAQKTKKTEKKRAHAQSKSAVNGAVSQKCVGFGGE